MYQFKTGSAVDIHGFEECATPEKHLVLGLVEFPDTPKLAGHSDGDAASHALADALLLAANLPDLGSQIGVDDPKWRNSSGEKILAYVMNLVKTEGYKVNNATLQIVAKRPKISPFAKQMGENLAKIVEGEVCVGATTTDNMLGELGSGDAVLVLASVLLYKASQN